MPEHDTGYAHNAQAGASLLRFPGMAPPPDNQCPYPPRSRPALAWALDGMNVQIRYNVRWHAAEFRYSDRGIWEALTGRAMAHLRARIAALFVIPTMSSGRIPMVFSRDTFTDALDAMLYRMEVRPIPRSTLTASGRPRGGAYCRARWRIVSACGPVTKSWHSGRHGLCSWAWCGATYDPGTPCWTRCP